MHVLWPIFHFQLNGFGKTTTRDSLGYFLVKVRSRLSQGQVKKGQLFKFIFLHKKGIYSMQLIAGNPVVVLVLFYVVKKKRQK